MRRQSAPTDSIRMIANILALVGWLLLCFAVAAVGAFASAEAPTFYGQLVQPAWAPPAWLFGPAWTILFCAMAIAAWLVTCQRRVRPTRAALGLFVVQLVGNGLWSWLFFAWQLGAASFVEILVLWGLILATLVAFWRVRPLAGALLIPYLGWVTFAATLNFTLWRANPTLLG